VTSVDLLHRNYVGYSPLSEVGHTTGIWQTSETLCVLNIPQIVNSVQHTCGVC